MALPAAGQAGGGKTLRARTSAPHGKYTNRLSLTQTILYLSGVVNSATLNIACIAGDPALPRSFHKRTGT